MRRSGAGRNAAFMRRPGCLKKVVLRPIEREKHQRSGISGAHGVTTQGALMDLASLRHGRAGEAGLDGELLPFTFRFGLVGECQMAGKGRKGIGDGRCADGSTEAAWL